MNLDEQPLFRSLASLDLPADDFIIAGSGPMLAHGIRSTLGDLDVVARGAAWDKALTLGTPRQPPRVRRSYRSPFRRNRNFRRLVRLRRR